MDFSSQTTELLRLALAEDVGSGDITSEATIDAELQGSAIIIARESLVVCGQQVAKAVFAAVDSSLQYEAIASDGQLVSDQAPVASIKGSMRSILSGERTALNFLQRLSGIASVTRKLTELVASSAQSDTRSNPVQLLDTRKTTPGWRQLEKYAVKTGGGTNHRIGLYDAFLIKNNHVDALGGDLVCAIEACRQYGLKQAAGGAATRSESGYKLQVEVRDEAELRAALSAMPDAILLDNMSPAELKHAVAIVRGGPETAAIVLEASGGINPSNLAEYSKTGVDFISLGMLTHSAPAVDLSLRYQSKDQSNTDCRTKKG